MTAAPVRTDPALALARTLHDRLALRINDEPIPGDVMQAISRARQDCHGLRAGRDAPTALLIRVTDSFLLLPPFKELRDCAVAAARFYRRHVGDTGVRTPPPMQPRERRDLA